MQGYQPKGASVYIYRPISSSVPEHSNDTDPVQDPNDPMVAAVAHARVCGWSAPDDPSYGVYVNITEILENRFDSDVHFLAYWHPTLPARLNKDILGTEHVSTPISMELQVFDVDCPASHKSQGGDGRIAASDEWFEAERLKLTHLAERHPGMVCSRTRGGYRIIFRRTTPFLISSKSDAEAWNYYYCRCCCYLVREYSIVPDIVCANWNRLFRAPHTTREPCEVPEEREVFGSLFEGAWNYQPTEDSLEADLDTAGEMAAHDRCWKGKVNTTLRPRPASEKQKRAPRKTNDAIPTDKVSHDDIVRALKPIVSRIDDSRHKLYLALSGTLCGRGFSPDRILAIVEELATSCGDEKVRARVHDASTTIDTYAEGGAVEGYGALALNWPEAAEALDSILTQSGTEHFLTVSEKLRNRPIPVALSLSESAIRLQSVIENAQIEPYQLTILRASTGVGKTYLACKAAVERSGKTAVCLPTNKLSEDYYKKAAPVRSDVQRRFGVLAHLDPRGQPSCAHSQLAQRVANSGLAVSHFVCGSCIQRFSCEARLGLEGTEDGSLLFTNHSLISVATEAVGYRGLLILDESPPLFEHEAISISDLQKTLVVLQSHIFTEDYRLTAMPAVEIVLKALEGRSENDSFDEALLQVAERQDVVEPLLDALQIARGGKPPFSSNSRGARDDHESDRMILAARTLKVLTRYFTSEAGRVGARWADQVARFAARASKPTTGLSPNELPEVVFTLLNEHLFCAFARPGPTILMDATLDVETLRHLISGRPVNDVQLEVEDGAPVKRVVKYWTKGTKQLLLPHGKPDWRLLGRALADTLQVLMAEGVRVVLIVTFKAIEKELRVREDNLPHGGAMVAMKAFKNVGGRVCLLHYGSLRSRNEFDGINWAELDAVVTIGDPYRNIAENIAESKIVGRNEQETWTALERQAEAELAQAHGRLRAPRRKKKGLCLHLGCMIPEGWHSGNAVLEAAQPGRPIEVGCMSKDEFDALLRRFGNNAKALAKAAQLSRATVMRAKTGHAITQKVAEALRGASSWLDTQCVSRIVNQENRTPSLLTITDTQVLAPANDVVPAKRLGG